MKRTRDFRAGMVSILAIQLLAVFAALAVSFVALASLEVRKADNLRAVTEAQLAAESGLSFMLGLIEQTELPVGTDATTVLAELGAVLDERLAFLRASPDAACVQISGAGLTVSQIQLPHGEFACQMYPVDVGGELAWRMTVTGLAGEASRRVSMDLALVTKRSSIFDYGVASRGTILVKGSASLVGLARPEEAAILSTRSSAPAIVVADYATVSGGLGVTGQTADYVSLLGEEVSVAGATDTETIMTQHVRLGVPAPRPLKLDTAPFAALAVETISSEKIEAETAELTNVRIAAGTNPNFQNVIVNGVLYVESPNLVKFTGKATINGVIVTEQDPWKDPKDCQIDFGGGVYAPGVDALPKKDERFTEIKQHRGTVILAPGFGVSFLGNVEAVNGVIAADEIYFSGNASFTGGLHGTIVGLTDAEMTFGGSAEIRLGQLEDDVIPAGFEQVKGFSAIPGSYAEPIGS